MELDEALSQIAEIRHQMARTEVFRGYRALPVALSGVLAICAGLVQAVWLPNPLEQIGLYLELWVGSAILSAVVAGAAMVDRRRRSASAWSREMTRLALDQFVPCLVAGGLLTVVVVASIPEALPLLPGLWQILFAMGIFASCRLLPRAIWLVAAFYLLSGLAMLIVARGPLALAPWAMGAPFGLGQLMAAGVLYWTLERDHGR